MRRPIRFYFSLIGLAVLLIMLGCRVNPVTGEKQLIIHSTQQELELGDRYHPNLIYMYNGRYDGKKVTRYMRAIVERIHKVSHRRDMRTDFTLLNTSINNAFAIPGHLYATRGFVAQLENEAQFAAVMAHEMAHVSSLHTARQMTTSMLTNLGLGLAAQAAGDSTAGKGLVAAGQVGVTLLGLSYSREQERQADRVGTYYMVLGGWDPREAISMQKLLASMNKREPTFVDKYLSTHPPADNRIKEIRGVIREKNLLDSKHLQGDGIFAERWNQHLSRLRRVNAAYKPYDKGMKLLAEKQYKKALSAANTALEQRTDQAPFYRLKGDALLELKQLQKARQQYARSLELDPDYIFANLGLGKIALREKKYQDAETQFHTTAEAFPANLSAQYGLGLARLNQHKYREAIQPLQKVVSGAPDAPEPHYYLAVCYDNTGRRKAALAEYRNALRAGLSGQAAQQARNRIQILESALGRNHNAQ